MKERLKVNIKAETKGKQVEATLSNTPFTFIKKPGHSNELLEFEDFYISYQSTPGGVIPIFDSDRSSPETALVKDDFFLILNGDFRDDYLDIAINGFQACYKFYLSKKKEYQSFWSTDQDRTFPEIKTLTN